MHAAFGGLPQRRNNSQPVSSARQALLESASAGSLAAGTGLGQSNIAKGEGLQRQLASYWIGVRRIVCRTPRCSPSYWRQG